MLLGANDQIPDMQRFEPIDDSYLWTPQEWHGCMFFLTESIILDCSPNSPNWPWPALSGSVLAADVYHFFYSLSVIICVSRDMVLVVYLPPRLFCIYLGSTLSIWAVQDDLAGKCNCKNNMLLWSTSAPKYKKIASFAWMFKYSTLSRQHT
jgi:hypothetical protein